MSSYINVVFNNGDIMRNQILCYVLKYNADWLKVEEAIRKNERFECVQYEEQFVTILDSQYPKELLRLQRPPWLLFYRGNLELLSMNKVSIIGTRMPSDYGLKATDWLVNELKEDICIVSGLAKGIDARAHWNALDSHTIAVVGSGLDIIYPLVNKPLWDKVEQKHLLLSEYPNGTKPFGYHFLIRNRIIAALSTVLVVVEAKHRSGSQRTVSDALEIGSNVFAIPQPFDSKTGEACNRLLSEGAQIVANTNDINLIKELINSQ